MNTKALCAALVLGLPVLVEAARAPDEFGMEAGNTWSYVNLATGEGPTVVRSVIECGNTTLLPPIPVCVIENASGGVNLNQWFAHEGTELRFYGGDAEVMGLRIAMSVQPPFIENWAYAKPSEHRVVRARVSIQPYGVALRGRMKAQMLGKEVLRLPFGTLNALKIKYQNLLQAGGQSSAETFYAWWVPRLGIVKQTGANIRRGALLWSFSILGDPDTPSDRVTSDPIDSDSDGLLDWHEAVLYKSDWRLPDTDGDGILDGADNCRLLSNDQADSDADLVGDACEASVAASAIRGTVIERSQHGGDGFDIRLDGCKGLDDAVFELGLAKQIHARLGHSDSGNLADARLSYDRSRHLYTLRQRDGGMGQIRVELNAKDNSLRLSSSRADLEISDRTFAASLEIDGWTCSASTQWRVRYLANGGIRYRTP